MRSSGDWTRKHQTEKRQVGSKHNKCPSSQRTTQLDGTLAIAVNHRENSPTNSITYYNNELGSMRKWVQWREVE